MSATHVYTRATNMFVCHVERRLDELTSAAPDVFVAHLKKTVLTPLTTARPSQTLIALSHTFLPQRSKTMRGTNYLHTT